MVRERVISFPRPPSRAAPGEDVPVEQVIAEWLPTVYAWCARLGGARIDAEEAAHDVMMILVRRYGELRDPAALPAWLFATSRRVVANHRRKAWWQRWLPGVALERWAGTDRTDGPSDEQDLAARVALALEKLSDEHREVLVLCYFEERSVQEASALLGVPAGTVKSRLFYAREKFQASFEREEP